MGGSRPDIVLIVPDGESGVGMAAVIPATSAQLSQVQSVSACVGTITVTGGAT